MPRARLMYRIRTSEGKKRFHSKPYGCRHARTIVLMTSRILGPRSYCVFPRKSTHNSLLLSSRHWGSSLHKQGKNVKTPLSGFHCPHSFVLHCTILYMAQKRYLLLFNKPPRFFYSTFFVCPVITCQHRAFQTKASLFETIFRTVTTEWNWQFLCVSAAKGTR